MQLRENTSGVKYSFTHCEIKDTTGSSKQCYSTTTH